MNELLCADGCDTDEMDDGTVMAVTAMSATAMSATAMAAMADREISMDDCLHKHMTLWPCRRSATRRNGEIEARMKTMTKEKPKTMRFMKDA